MVSEDLRDEHGEEEADEAEAEAEERVDDSEEAELEEAVEILELIRWSLELWVGI